MKSVACADCYTRCFRNIIEKKSKILAFRDRFDILMENNLSGVAMCLMGNISLDEKAETKKTAKTKEIPFTQKSCPEHRKAKKPASDPWSSLLCGGSGILHNQVFLERGEQVG